jgi:hypothetical protein
VHDAHADSTRCQGLCQYTVAKRVGARADRVEKNNGPYRRRSVGRAAFDAADCYEMLAPARPHHDAKRATTEQDVGPGPALPLLRFARGR